MNDKWINFFETEFDVFVIKPWCMIVYLLIGVFCFCFIRIAGPKVLLGGYHTNLEQYSNDEISVLNIIYRIISPVVFSYFIIIVLSIVFSIIGVRWEFEIYWMPVLFYWVIQIVVVASTKIGIYPLWTLFVQAFVSLCVSIYFDWVVIQQFPNRGIESLDQSNIGWQVLTGFFLAASYLVLYGIIYSSKKYKQKLYKHNNVFQYSIDVRTEERLYKYLRKYDNLLSTRYQSDLLLKAFFYTVLTIEDSNRPSWFRRLERLFFWTGKVKTTGIMQVKENRKLTDEESVHLGAEIVEEIWNNFIYDVAEHNSNDSLPMLMFSSEYYGYDYSSMKDALLSNGSKLYGRYCGTLSYDIRAVLKTTIFFFESYKQFLPAKTVRVHSALFKNQSSLLPNRILCFREGILSVAPQYVPIYNSRIIASITVDAGFEQISSCVEFLEQYSYVISIDYLTSLEYVITATANDTSFINSIPVNLRQWKFTVLNR